MNKFIIILVLLNTLVLGHTIAAAEGNWSCTPNSVFMDDCNTCRCLRDGSGAACTEMGCPERTTKIIPKKIAEDLYVHNSDSTAVNTNGNNVCTPNEIKMQVESNDICNRCKCAANGIAWFCTKIPCPARDVHKRSVTSRGCKIGDILSDGCNHCICDSAGIPSCTHFPCIETRHKRSTVNDKECTPGESWKSDCNNCFCTETGVEVCTLRGCLSRHQPPTLQIPIVPPSAIRSVGMDEYNRDDFECTPYEYFKLECNSCKCYSDGKTSRCTKKACNVPDQ